MSGIRLEWKSFLLTGLVALGFYPFLGYSARVWTYVAVGLFSVLALVVGVARMDRRTALPWFLFLGFMGMWVAGDIAFYGLGALSGEELGFPSVADVFYLAAYPLWFGGLAVLVRRRVGRQAATALLDGAVVAIAFGLLSWVFVNHSVVHEAASASAQVVAVMYPILDVLLVALVVRSFLVAPSNVAARFLLGAVGSLLVADISYQVMILEGFYNGYVDILWLVCYLCVGVAALHPDATTYSRPVRDPETQDVSRGRIGLLLLAALVAPGVLVLRADALDADLIVVTGAAAGSMILLVLARLNLQIIRTMAVLDGLHRSDAFLRQELDARRKAERTSVEREAFARGVLDSIPAHTAVLDEAGTIVAVNRSWTDFMEGAGGDVSACGIGADYLAVCDAAQGPGSERAAKMAAAIRAILAGHLDEYVVQYECKSPERKRWFNVQIAPLRTGPGAVVAHFDVTEQVFLEQQLTHSHKLEAVGQLAGGVAHDFNNLLAVILSYAELSRDEVSDEVRADIDEILKAGRKASDLVRQLLTFARSEPIEPEDVEPAAALSEMEKLLGVTLGDGCALELSVAEGTPSVRMDRAQFDQILMNFAANARDAMSGVGRLSVTVERRILDPGEAMSLRLLPGEYVMLKAVDEGVGIDPELLPRIFEPFFSTKPRERGTGLGLATVHGIVTRAGGAITVHSEVGEGTTFTVFLPASTEQVPFAGTHTVLVVEDEEPVRRAVTRMLVAGGFDVLSAATAADAVELFADNLGAVDLVLTDVIMPLTSGPELIDRLSELGAPPRFLYMSGYSLEHLNLEEHRSAPLLAKPFTEAQLFAAVEAAIEGRALRPTS